MKYLPIKFHIIYILFTLLVSFYGPKVYFNYNKVLVGIYILAYLIVVYIGFKRGVNSRIKGYSSILFTKERLLNIFKKSVIISVILYFAYIVYLSTSGRLNLSISAIGENYVDYYQYYIEKTSNTLFTFEILFLVISAIPKFIALALGFFYFNDLSKFYKRAFILLLLLIILTQTLSLGNQKSIGDIAIFALIALVIKSSKLIKSKRNKLIRRSLLILTGLFIILSFTQYSRLNSRGISSSDLNSYIAEYSHFDWEHPVFKIFGTKIGLGVSTFVTGYLSGGYYGLSKSLELPFEWSYGVGNSIALSNIVEKSFDVDIFSETYLFRMEREFGILGKQQWHTIFPWLASDFTFVGTLILFLFISYYYGKAWQEVLKFNNPISLLLFSLLSIMFIFVPANNQILHGFDYFIITVFIVIFWKRNHNKYNFIQ